MPAGSAAEARERSRAQRLDRHSPGTPTAAQGHQSRVHEARIVPHRTRPVDGRVARLARLPRRGARHVAGASGATAPGRVHTTWSACGDRPVPVRFSPRGPYARITSARLREGQASRPRPRSAGYIGPNRGCRNTAQLRVGTAWREFGRKCSGVRGHAGPPRAVPRQAAMSGERGKPQPVHASRPAPSPGRVTQARPVPPVWLA